LSAFIGGHRRQKITIQDQGSRIQLLFRVIPCVSVARWISSAFIGGLIIVLASLGGLGVLAVQILIGLLGGLGALGGSILVRFTWRLGG
jgi:hypothetical protein